MARYVPLALFLVVSLGGGTLIGISTAPGAWYAALQKPAFNPPDWLFAPVWTILYVLIAFAGWRVWTRRHAGGAMTVWWLQLSLNFLWSPVFFTLHQIAAALVIIIALLATIVAFMAITWSRDRLCAFLFIPYLLWVGFAAYLNFALLVLN